MTISIEIVADIPQLRSSDVISELRSSWWKDWIRLKKTKLGLEFETHRIEQVAQTLLKQDSKGEFVISHDLGCHRKATGIGLTNYGYNALVMPLGQWYNTQCMSSSEQSLVYEWFWHSSTSNAEQCVCVTLCLWKHSCLLAQYFYLRFRCLNAYALFPDFGHNLNR